MLRLPKFLYTYLLFAALVPASWGQGQISRFAGETGEAVGEGHFIELFNESPIESWDVSQYWILTGRYTVQLPSNLVLKPLGRLRLTLEEKVEGTIALKRQASFLLQIDPPQEGDFILLLTPIGNIVDAMYFHPEGTPSFIPENVQKRTGAQLSAFQLPAKDNPIWKPLRAGKDPALAFVQINGQWFINSRSKNLLPACEFLEITTDYTPDGVLLNWRTQDERDCYNFIIERSQDGNVFQEIQRIEGGQNFSGERTYTFTDKEVRSDLQYVYRIKNEDKFGNVLYSNFSSLYTGKQADSFFLDLLGIGEELTVRFVATESQEIRLKLMDADFREVEVLFDGPIQAERDYLIKYSANLSLGKYYLIANTLHRRIYKEFIIQ